ncbi:AAA family ATPase [Nitrospira sp. MA-1]|nr:AAA family ATPase [Nitrospira sp. MA-1]
MRITRIYIEGFKRFTQFELELNPTFNVIVGDNETGKSSLLEAIALVLTSQYEGRLIQYAIDPYLFNAAIVREFFAKRQISKEAQPPRVLIEAYLDSIDDDPALAKFSGTNNTKSEDCPGLVMTIEVDSNQVEALKEYAADDSNPTVLPVEFFRATWRSFSGEGVSLRQLPFRVAMIDTSLSRMYRGPNKYLSQVVNDVLNESQRRELSLAYKKLQHQFAHAPGVTAINEHLKNQGNAATSKELTVQVDMSSRASWDSAITAHLDNLPFDCAGKGEQCRVQLRLAIAGAEQSQVLLIEEPENHLSHSNLNMLMDDIRKDCLDRQVIITTHSGFVLNKLGIDNLRLISYDGRSATLEHLTSNTKDYFMKLPGYDTLRLILSQKSILVERPSDELIVQRAYKEKHGKLPLEDGIDVISVGALAFKRFLEIAALLNLDVRVVTDNDGDVAALKGKYSSFINDDSSKIRILFDDDESHPTLEPQLLKANSLQVLNTILNTTHSNDQALLKYMNRYKTDCALKLFETAEEWIAPEYIIHAIE